MTPERQIYIPASFIELYRNSSGLHPKASRLWIEQRYELCEDLAQLLHEKIKDKVWQLGITEGDALERVIRGLGQLDLSLSDPEIQWVTRRIKELLSQA